MEVKSIQNSIKVDNNYGFGTKKVVTNPYSGEKREIELPDIKSANYALNIQTPQNYTHINTFDIPQVGKAHFYKLQNGQRVIIVPTDSETVVKTHVNVGSMNEPDNLRGISHYIEHNLFNGTEKLDAGEFFKQTNQMGAKTNASTGFAKTDYFIATHLLDDKDLEKTISLHADMIENPAFKIEQLEKEKGPIISEIAMVLDSDSNLVTNRALKNLFQIQSTSTDIIAGEAKNIQALTRDDVINYYKTWYTPDNMVTVVTGNVEPEKTMQLIAKNFKKQIQKHPSISHFEKFTPITSSVREDFISKKSPSANVILATSGPNNSSAKENIKTEALLTYLMGYKSSVLRDKLSQMGASISANVERVSNLPSQNSAIIIALNTPENHTEDAIKAVYDAIAKIYDNPPSPQELETIKNNMLKGYRLGVESSNNVNDFVAQGFLFGNVDTLLNTENYINQLTTKDIQDAAKTYLDLNKVSLVVSHASKSDKSKIENAYNRTNRKVAFKGLNKKDLEITNPSEVRQIILPNNMTLVVEKSKTDLSMGQFAFTTKIPAKCNIMAPMILAKMLSLGHEGRTADDYKKQLDEKAVSLDFEVSDRSIMCSLNCNSKDLDFALKNLNDVISHPKLDEKTFNQKKTEVINLINRKTNNSEDYLLKELFGERFKKFATKEDLIKALETVTLEDVKQLYQYIMTNSSATAAISTNNTETITQNSPIIKTMSSLDYKFKDYKIGNLKVYEPNTTAKTITHVKEQKQADIVQAYTFDMGNNLKDKVTIDLLNMILGGTPSSRLFSDLREKQKLAYRVSSYVDKFENTGMIKLAIATTTEDKENNVQSFDNIQKSLSGFDKHVNMLRTQKVSEKELDGVKRFLKSKMLEMKDSQYTQTISLIVSMTKHEGIEYFNKYLKMIDTITTDDIYNAANYVFANEPVTSIVASKNTINSLQ